MFDETEYETQIAAAGDVSGRVDRCYGLAQSLGFSAVIYDFAPIALTPEGEMLIPSVIQSRNMPSEMYDLWCRQGYYHRDPVQRLALKVSRPFFWSYNVQEQSPILRLLDDYSFGVAEALRDWRVTRGITIPLHLPERRFATVTGLWNDDIYREGVGPISRQVAEFSMLAHVLHDCLTPLFGKRELTPTAAALTPRERQCIVLAAQGLSTKQIAWRLERSHSTAVMHLQSAARKLGARNRVQAVARAAHYGYLS